MTHFATVSATHWTVAARPRTRPYWNPYVAGVVLGLVLLATYLVAGRGLGATGAFSAVVAAIAQALAPEAARANPVHARYLADGAPLLDFLPMLVLGVFVGGWISGRTAGRIRFGLDRGPSIGDAPRLAMAFAGGTIVAFGAKIALGCTSGQALSGAAVLNVGSLVFMGTMFVAGYAVAFLIRKEWL
ncbi:MAG TPA: YeeE/YedE thiosulfate transporter family protein [Casimicrobiaceae bacterium]|nr:YeeE/YedE thiosulfate transporter family protein [Casimicrobiaceae bacterium]